MVTINASPERSLQLGYAGEDKVTKVIFPYDESWLEYGDGEFFIRVLRPGDTEPYNAQDVTNDSEAMALTLVVTDVELSRQGYGQMQVVYIGPQVVKKSRIYAYRVSKAIDEPVDPPNGSIINQIVQSLGDLSDLTTTAKTDLVSAINEVNDKSVDITVDDALSTTSTNPVQNKVVTSAIQSKADTATVSALADAVQDLDGNVQGLQTAVQGKIDDAQVNGTSIVSNGVAVFRTADSQTFGLIKLDTSGQYGLTRNDNGLIYIYQATSANIKGGSVIRKPIVPQTQHESAFYGLAKAAGHDEKNSAFPVGQYSDEAKIAIQKMLGIYEAPWELIKEDTFTNEEVADHVITTDANGNAFELTDAILLFETPKQETEAKFGGTVRNYFYDVKNWIANETYTYTQSSNSTSTGIVSAFEQRQKMLNVWSITRAAASNFGGYSSRYGANFGIPLGRGDRVSYALLDEPIYCYKISILQVIGTGHYILYGKRKWT